MTASALDALPTRPPRTVGPWTADHLNRLLLGNGAGLVLVLTGWWQVSGSGSVRTQATWLVASIAGVLVAGISNATWLMRGLQSISLGREIVLPQLRQSPRLRRRAYESGPARRLVQVPGTARVHRPDCPLVAGKDVNTVIKLRKSEVRPCEVCEPT